MDEDTEIEETPDETPVEDIPASIPTETTTDKTVDPSPETPVEQSTGADSFSEIADTLLKNKPEKQDFYVNEVQRENALDADKEDLKAVNNDWRLLRDKNGHYWEAGKCSGKVDQKTGQPEKGKKGMWILLKNVKRKQLSKKPPEIETAEKSEAQGVADVQVQAAGVETKAARNTLIFMSLWLGISSKVNGADETSEVMQEKLPFVTAPGQKPLTVYDLHTSAINELLVKYGGGPDAPPEVVVPSLLLFYGLKMAFKKPERKANFKEKIGLWWHRRKSRKAAAQ